MHILQIIHGFPPIYQAGSEVYTRSLCRGLSVEHRITLLSRSHNDYLPDFHLNYEHSEPNIHQYTLNKRIDKDSFQAAEIDRIVAQIIAENRPDVAHIQHLNHLSTGIVDVLADAGIPIVFTLHDFWLMCPRGQFLQRNYGEEKYYQLCHKQDDATCALRCYSCYFSGQEAHRQRDAAYWTSWVHARMEASRALAGRVDRFIAPSRYLMKRFISDFGIAPHRIQYLDYGFPPLQPVPAELQERRVFTFGYIGTHIPSKGVDLLLEAFMQVKADACLIIWGGTGGQSENYLKNKSLLCRNKVLFSGTYDNETIAQEVFSRIDCLVVPSIWAENSPLVIHEAQACRVPVITSDFGGMAEYVRHLENGLLFEHRDRRSLTATMEFAVEHPELMRQFGQRGYLYRPDGCVPELNTHCKEIVSVYQQLTHS